MDGLAQDCSNSSAGALELPQSCTKPLKYERDGGILTTAIKLRTAIRFMAHSQ